jgi:benzoate membrane transport protein
MSALLRDLSPSAIYMGLLAAFAGYSASFAIVLAGLSGIGATEAQAATGLFFATLAMAVCSIWLPSVTRIPAAVAWSTPGAAFLASSVALPGGFAEAVGAFILCAGLIILTGLVPRLGRLVAAIPKPIANALLAGVLFRLCIAPALAFGSAPTLIVPVLAAWLAGLTWHRLAAMPLAVLAFIVVLLVTAEMPIDSQVMGRTFLPAMSAVAPQFTFAGFVSIALPLYVITMAGQNVPGFAVLELHGYRVKRGPLLRNTGLASLAVAPFGAIPVNMSAIVAAMMSGEDAGRDPARRYWAAIVNGLALIVLAFLAGLVTQLASLAPAALVTGLAGLALIPAFVAALKGVFGDTLAGTEAPALTFLIVASGMTLLGVSGAVWGLLVGALVWVIQRARVRQL